MSREKPRRRTRKFIKGNEWTPELSRQTGDRRAAAPPGVEDFDYQGIAIEIPPVGTVRNRAKERTLLRNPKKLP